MPAMMGMITASTAKLSISGRKMPTGRGDGRGQEVDEQPGQAAPHGFAPGPPHLLLGDDAAKAGDVLRLLGLDDIDHVVPRDPAEKDVVRTDDRDGGGCCSAR